MTSQELTAKPRERVPRHVAIVMDGNGRWAKARKLPRLMGHQKGVESVRTAIQAAAKTGVQHLTLFAFSSENWNRPADEVKGLMKLFLVSLRREIAALNKANVRVRLVGDLTAFSEELQEQIADSMKITENNTGLTLNVCVNYGGRWEILEAAKRCRDIPLEELTEQKFASLLPVYPYERGRADQQFYAVAACLRRAVFHKNFMARFHRERVFKCAKLVLL